MQPKPEVLQASISATTKNGKRLLEDAKFLFKTGEVGLHPGLVTGEQAAEAIERAERLQEIPVTFSDEYLALKEVLPALFANLTIEPT